MLETYNRDIYFKNGINQSSYKTHISYSRHNVLRGIHGDRETWKLILAERFYIIVVNNDEDSSEYKNGRASQ